MASNSAVKKVVTVIPIKPVEVVKGFALGAKKRVPLIAGPAPISMMFNRIYENRESFIKTMTANIETIILQKPDISESETLDKRIEELENKLKGSSGFR